MIIKKPFAFLIKNFRRIHLIIAILMAYSCYKISSLNSFFSQIVQNSTISNVPTNLIDVYLSLTIILLIGFSITMYVLMKKKEKPSKFYFFMIIYYVVLLILLVVFNTYLETVSEGTAITLETKRAFSDIGTIVSYPQYVLFLFILFRTTGFDIKKFDFGKDLKELEITSTDSEEFEFVLGFDFHRIKIKFKRQMREFRYYFLENIKIFLMIFGGIIIIAVLYFGYNIIFAKKVYNETEQFTVGTYQTTILRSYMTNIAQNGIVIDDNKYYMVLHMKFTNLTSEMIVIPTSNYMIVTENNSYLPEFSKNNHFNDLGDPYNNEMLEPRVDYYYLLIYEIDKSDIQESYQLRVGSLYTLDANGNRVMNYTYVNLNPTLIDSVNTNETLIFDESKTNNMLDFSNSLLGESYMRFRGYSIGKKYNYSYRKCYSEDECYDYVNVYTASNTTYNSTLIAIDSSIMLNDQSIYYQYNKDEFEFYRNFLLIKYNYNGIERTVTPTIVNTKDYTEKIVVEVPASIESAIDIELLFVIRNQKYPIKIK